MNTKINTLSRNEMKLINAGSIPEYECELGMPDHYVGCVNMSQMDCYHFCVDVASYYGTTCGDCRVLSH